MFVLDCTGSMQGEIDAIRDAILAFADSIRSEGVRARVGLIAFRDRLIGEEARVLMFGGEPFTDDPVAFRREVSSLSASGGGDAPESSLDALQLALRQPFAPDSNKVIVLVTDAPPHVPDKDVRSVEDLTSALQAAGVSQLYLVISTKDGPSQVYLKLLEGIKGLAFDLGSGNDFRSRAEHFKRTLMSLGKTISQSTR
jgi:Mg-chelatase subunit ChlD